MPLPAPVEREHLHSRSYDFQGFRRDDGLWDIEGRLLDTKTYGFENAHRGTVAAGEPIHDMWIRLTIDEDFLVHDIEAVTEQGPFEICPAIAPDFKKMKGERVGPGWRQAIRRHLAGTAGCTHLSEMLAAMATVAYQTLYPTLAKKAPRKPAERPGLIDGCHAFRSDGEEVKRRWPDFYTGS